MADKQRELGLILNSTGRVKEGAWARVAQRNEKTETEEQGGTCRRRPGVTGTVVWRWREKEQEEAWSNPSVLRQHRNVKASPVLLEDSLQKIRKFTFKFRVRYLPEISSNGSHLQGRDS